MPATRHRDPGDQSYDRLGNDEAGARSQFSPSGTGPQDIDDIGEDGLVKAEDGTPLLGTQKRRFAQRSKLGVLR